MDKITKILEELVRDRVNSVLGYRKQDYTDEAIAKAQQAILDLLPKKYPINKCENLWYEG